MAQLSLDVQIERVETDLAEIELALAQGGDPAALDARKAVASKNLGAHRRARAELE